MPNVSRLGDSIQGTTAGEHSGHISPHSPLPITGKIDGNCSPNVYVNGIAIALINATTEEHDACCGTNKGVVSGCSSTVFANSRGVVRIGDAVTPHSGTASVTGGSSNVFAN